MPESRNFIFLYWSISLDTLLKITTTDTAHEGKSEDLKHAWPGISSRFY